MECPGGRLSSGRRSSLVPSNPKGTDGEATWSGSTSPAAVGVDHPFPTSAVVFSEVAEAKGCAIPEPDRDQLHPRHPPQRVWAG